MEEIFLQNDTAPKDLTIPMMRGFAEENKIDIQGLKLKADIFAAIKGAVFSSSLSRKRKNKKRTMTKMKSPLRPSSPPKVSSSSRPSSPPKVSSSSSRPSSPPRKSNIQKSLFSLKSTMLPFLFSEEERVDRKSPLRLKSASKKEIPHGFVPEGFAIINLDEDVNLIPKIISDDISSSMDDDKDLLKIFTDYKVNSASNSAQVQEYLESISNSPYYTCKWLDVSLLEKLGGGAQGLAYKKGELLYKISVNYNYIDFLTVAFVHRINRSRVLRNLPNLMKIRHIQNCNNVIQKDVHTNPGTVEISEFVIGYSLATIRSFKRPTAHILAQVILTSFILSINKMAHFDLHDDNIIVRKTKTDFITYPLLGKDFVVPTHGEEGVMIDYGMVGMVYDEEVFNSRIAEANVSDSFSNKNFIKRYPVYFILNAIRRILTFMPEHNDKIGKTILYKIMQLMQTDLFTTNKKNPSDEVALKYYAILIQKQDYSVQTYQLVINILQPHVIDMVQELLK